MTVAGVTCRWDRFPLWVVTLWNHYAKYHKRGGIPLAQMSPEMLDCVDAELYAEAAKSRKEREAKAQQDFLRAQGLIK